MKIVIDSAIPFIVGLFEPYAEVVYLGGGEFTPEAIHDANALIIRTRTRCDEQLLEGSMVSHIATATIGYDHIDLEYCQRKGIHVTTAQGCNARGVLQWVSAALAHLAKRDGWCPHERTLGVVGVGNVGRLIKEYASAWGFNVICCDPPRKMAEGISDFVSFEEMLPRVDILTLHTPLNESSYHLLNSDSIKQLKPSVTVINTSRGEVIESQAILENRALTLAFDVWEEEPYINSELLQRAAISTTHIAGYSLQGKANGTAAVVRDIAEHFDLPLKDWYPAVTRNMGVAISWDEMCASISQHFDIEQESRQLKESPELFESIRNNYNYREEYF